MRITKLMGLAVIVVALAAAINALAFKTASVTNSFSITVDDTSAAALALSGGTGSGFSSTIANGKLSIAITDKMQPNSEYFFGPVFTITNNNANAVNLTHALSGFTNVTITLVQADGTTAYNATSLGTGAGNTRAIYLKISPATGYFAGAATTTALSGTLVITATE